MSKPPLDGIRVADFCWAWAGPYGALQLAHLGAEVIRIESQTRLCPSRMIPPWADNETGINRCGYFNQYNQGKRSLSLDLKKPEGIQLAKQLVAKSDIVIENFAGGGMEKMGLGYEVLRAIKPDIIMASLSGYGQTGPEKGYVSYGPPQVALSGMSALTGYIDDGPRRLSQPGRRRLGQYRGRDRGRMAAVLRGDRSARPGRRSALCQCRRPQGQRRPAGTDCDRLDPGADGGRGDRDAPSGWGGSLSGSERPGNADRPAG